MNVEFLISLIGSVVAVCALIGGLIVRDRQVHKAISDGDAELHKRITKVQEDYVRRDDLYNHVQSIENCVNHMRNEQRSTNARIDALLAAMSKPGT